jgi:hypothetical protein
VHQHCYGLTSITSTTWFCSACATCRPPRDSASSAPSGVDAEGAEPACLSTSSPPQNATPSLRSRRRHAGHEGARTVTRLWNDRCQCVLCPVPGGALKPCSVGLWVHVVCARFAGMTLPDPRMEPVEGLREVAAGKGCDGWECSRAECKGAGGFKIKCGESRCSLRFHVACAVLDRSPLPNSDCTINQTRNPKPAQPACEISVQNARCDDCCQ